MQAKQRPTFNFRSNTQIDWENEGDSEKETITEYQITKSVTVILPY